MPSSDAMCLKVGARSDIKVPSLVYVAYQPAQVASSHGYQGIQVASEERKKASRRAQAGLEDGQDLLKMS